jgi:hypothetical protein
MALSRSGYGIIGFIVLLLVFVTIIAVFESTSYTNPLGLVIRLSALYGYLMTAIAVFMTSHLSWVAHTFGRPFIHIHHTFAILGIALVTLHPISFALFVMSAMVFIPSFQSWIDFWASGGRVAFIFLYFGVLGGLLRSRWRRWRYLHALMYVVLLFAIIHANLIGTDFANSGILWFYNLVFAAVVVTFMLNLRRKWRSSIGRALRPNTGK